MASKSGEKKIRAALIGYGPSFNMGQHHAESITKAGMKVVAVCDIDLARCEAA